MTAVIPSTKLSAVNVILSTIGQSAVSTLSGTLDADTTLAVATLDEVDLETQSRGWHFNTEANVLLTRDGSNKIAQPANTIRTTVPKELYPNLDITIRDDSGTLRLYDKITHSFALPYDVKAELIYLFDFEKTPESYRRFVMVRAARLFADRALGSQLVHVFTKQDELEARRFLLQHEDAAGPRSIFDSYAAYRVIDRAYPGSGRWGANY